MIKLKYPTQIFDQDTYQIDLLLERSTARWAPGWLACVVAAPCWVSTSSSPAWWPGREAPPPSSSSPHGRLCCIGWGQTTRPRAPWWSGYPEYFFIPCLVTGTPSSGRLSFSWRCTQPPWNMFYCRNSWCQNSTAREALQGPCTHLTDMERLS